MSQFVHLMQLELLTLGEVMFEKSFITDCEGPLTLNDNAFELAEHFIENGGKLFKTFLSVLHKAHTHFPSPS